MQYTLRKITQDDYEFLRRLHHVVMRPYVEAIWGWNEEKQDEIVRQDMAGPYLSIIVCAGKDIGQVSIERNDEKLSLVDLFILPECQGQGIGSAVIKSILAEADAACLPVTLRLFKTNPAKQLYEQLGFRMETEDDTWFHMRYSPMIH